MTVYFEDKLAEELRDPAFAKEYKALEMQSQLANQVIQWRQKRGLTQAQLAERLGTRQSSISRLENMSGLPSLSFLVRVAEVLGVKVDVRFFEGD